jgi:hypothetical protein
MAKDTKKIANGKLNYWKKVEAAKRAHTAAVNKAKKRGVVGDKNLAAIGYKAGDRARAQVTAQQKTARAAAEGKITHARPKVTKPPTKPKKKAK